MPDDEHPDQTPAPDAQGDAGTEKPDDTTRGKPEPSNEKEGSKKDDAGTATKPARKGKRKRKKKRKRRKRLKGFAGLLSGILGQLNAVDRFKQRFADVDLQFLFVATDMPPAARVHFNHGTVEISEAPYKSLKDLKKVERDGLLQCTLQQFMDIAAGKLNPAKAWITRKIKIRGPRSLLKIVPIFRYIKI